MEITAIKDQIIAKYDEYVKHLKMVIYCDCEIHEGRYEPELFSLKQQLESVDIAEIKSTPIPSGWICPRCQKVHSWLNMTCDCPPNVITASTTEPIKELAEIRGIKQTCSNCKYAQLRATQYPCSECNWGEHDLKWEPKTE